MRRTSRSFMRQRWQRWTIPSHIPRWCPLMCTACLLPGLWRPRRRRVLPSTTIHTHTLANPLLRRQRRRRLTPTHLLHSVPTLLPHRSLKQPLLPRPPHNRRLPRKNTLQKPQQLRNTTPLPPPHPIPQIRVIHPPIHTHMLSRPNNHVAARRHIRDGGLAGVGVREPEFEGEAVGCAAEGYW